MDPADLPDAVREDNRTELSRLGSSKALYALTEGEMETPVVRARAADRFFHAAERLDAWASDAEGAADLYAEAAALLQDFAESAAGDLADYDRGPESEADAVLGDYDYENDRLGALVGWTLVAGKLIDQLTGYFVGQADPQTAQVFRDAGDDVDELLAETTDAMADDGDVEEAREAAEDVIEVAYEEYFETLEDLGVNPKPVC